MLFVFLVWSPQLHCSWSLAIRILQQKKKSWLVESLNLNCHLTISTNSTHKHDEPWLQLHAHQIHWHQSSYWQIPFRSLKEKDTELCDTDCNLTALLPVICKYVYCQTVKPSSRGGQDAIAPLPISCFSEYMLAVSVEIVLQECNLNLFRLCPYKITGTIIERPCWQYTGRVMLCTYIYRFVGW